MGMIVRQQYLIKGLITISGLLCGLAMLAQPSANKPTSVTQTPAAAGQVATVPGNYSVGTPVSYVRTFEAQGPYTTVTAFDAAGGGSTGYQHVRQSTQYVDGLGRLSQTVARQATPGTSPKDLVSPALYDAFGRVSLQYLPYVQTTTAASDGAFKMNAFGEQDYFYKNVYKDANNALMLPGEQTFYNRTEYETSPLNRVTKQFAPGNSWAGSYNPSNPSGEKAVKQLYLINTADDDVQIWIPGNTALSFTANQLPDGLNIPTRQDEYAAGTLYKSVAIDEAGNATVEYKDMEGKVILKKVQIGTIASDYSGYAGFLCTYYVYDDLNRLRFVIPPKAVEAISASSWSISTAIANELCFRYEYDNRNRMQAKKVPGAGWVYMVYDVRDRLVFTQDANMRIGNQWLTTLYDALNRPVMSGMLTYSGTLDALQTAVNTQTAIPGSPNTSLAVDLVLDNPNTSGVHQAMRSVSMEDDFETTTSGEFTAELVAGPGGTDGETSSIEGMEINKNPIPSGATFIPLTITYYDNYSWTNKTYTTAYNSQLDAGSNLHAEALPGAASALTTGLVTGTKVRVLEDPVNLAAGKWLTTVSFYDDRGRAVQTIADNYRDATDVLINRYDFTGKVLTTYQVIGLSGQRIKTNMEYDHAGRILEVWKTINDELAKKALITKNSYDALGNLLTKEVGQQRDGSGNYTSTSLEVLKYNYNVRGWLAGINKDYANGQSSGDSRYFGMELNYDWGFGTNQYNGNISGTKWRSKGDGERRSYGFTYDVANRLLGGDFAQYSSGSYTDHATINFDMQMGNGSNAGTAYDANGNILAMKQWGLKGLTSNVLDELTYHYNTSSNKLKNVVDAANEVDTKLGDFRTSQTHVNRGTRDASAIDYTYDDNGNLKKDLNKDMGTAGADGIVYNHLNLPYRITARQPNGDVKGTITYIYDAAGNKLEKRVVENTTGPAGVMTSRTLYQSGAVYESKADQDINTPDYTDKLQFIGTEEGRFRPQWDVAGTSITSYVYDYMLKDHLGNVRMLLTDEKKTDMYPAATMEEASIATEESYYNNLTTTQYNKPAWFTDANYPSNAKVARLKNEAGSQKIGPNIVLKVMAGDSYNIRVSAGWNSGSSATNSSTNVLNDLLNILSTGVAGQSGGKVAAGDLQAGGSGLNSALTSFLGAQTTTGTKPKAYLNWILLDEQFKVVNGSNGFVQVGSSGSATALTQTGLTVPKSGYLYIYTSNEATNIDVFFDNLQVTHIRGAILEETHYYPFGLTMAGISSKALKCNYSRNKKKFNGVELSSKDFSDGSGLELYETIYRSYDPQIGRFHQIDALSDLNLNWSTYTFAQNNPILFSDPYGLDTIRGKLPKDYKPQPGDVWINKKGQEAVYHAGEGWVQSQTLKNVTVGGKGASKMLQATYFLIGISDTYYGMWEGTYDHKNYTTTKGKVRPLPTGKHISQQAKMYKQRSNVIRGTGFGLSLLANLLTAIQIRDEYLKGGGVNAVDVTGLTLGTTGLAANGLSYFGLAPKTMSTISTIAGKGSLVLTGFQNMYMALDFIYNQPGINNYRPSTGNTGDDIIMNNEYDSGIYNWTDYFKP
jgi:RHS repeat-associated protein